MPPTNLSPSDTITTSCKTPSAFMTTRIHSKSHPQAALPSMASNSLIPKDRLIEIYTAMLKCRMLRERVGNLAKVGKKRAFNLGSEAVAAATLIDAQPDDSLISATLHRCAALLKGVPPVSLLPPLATRSANANPGFGPGQVHVVSGVLVAPLAGAGFGNLGAAGLAAGCAFAARRGNRGNVVIAFYEGDNAEKSWREIFHFALAHHLPVILIRQSSHSLRSVSRRGRSAKSASGSLPIIPVDANDAVAVYRVAHEAIAHARRGSGPTLIDCVPLRLPGERKQDSDCIARMERYLMSIGLRPDNIRAKVTQKFTHALDAAATAVRRDVRRNGNRAVPGSPFRSK